MNHKDYSKSDFRIMEANQNMQFESEIYYNLLEAEKEAEHIEKRYSIKEVLKAMKDAIEK